MSLKRKESVWEKLEVGLVEKGCYDIGLIREAAFTCLCEGSNDREEFEEDALTAAMSFDWPEDDALGGQPND